MKMSAEAYENLLFRIERVKWLLVRWHEEKETHVSDACRAVQHGQFLITEGIANDKHRVLLRLAVKDYGFWTPAINPYVEELQVLNHQKDTAVVTL